MPLTTYERRIVHRNPIEPFMWVAEYIDGTQLRQFEPEGIIYSKAIDKLKLKSLWILGHRHSPIELPVPFSLIERPIKDVVVKCTTDIKMPMGAAKGTYREMRWFFGYEYEAMPKYPQRLYLLEIDQYGELYKTNSDIGQGTGANDVIIKGGGL